MSNEIRAIKFYMDKKYNKKKCYKDLVTFFNECQDTENKLIEYYWNNLYDVINATNAKDFYNNRIPMPGNRIKFHHYMNILFQVYECLTSIKNDIINNRLKFILDDKNKQKVYNYCKNFCFRWDDLVAYIEKVISKPKSNNKETIIFLKYIKKNYIINNNAFIEMQSDIENQFYTIKESITMPHKKSLQIRCSTFHTLKIDKSKLNKWIFSLDSNRIIGGTEKKPIFEKIHIPVKMSEYHYSILENHEMNTTFNLSINRYGRIEIVGCYKQESNSKKITTKKENNNDCIGIDIGVKKLISTSNGDFIDQNFKIINLIKQLLTNQNNRQNLQNHIRVKKENSYTISSKKYLKIQNHISRFLDCDIKYKLKRFVQQCSQNNETIIMEDVHFHEAKTYNKEVNNMIRKLKIQKIKTNIIKYCNDFNVKLELVNPAFTSQQCSCCGNINPKNRRASFFKCSECGYSSDADINASINIKNRFLKGQSCLSLNRLEIKKILTKN